MLLKPRMDAKKMNHGWTPIDTDGEGMRRFELRPIELSLIEEGH
jgi:hypothetical protein